MEQTISAIMMMNALFVNDLWLILIDMLFSCFLSVHIYDLFFFVLFYLCEITFAYNFSKMYSTWRDFSAEGECYVFVLKTGNGWGTCIAGR